MYYPWEEKYQINIEVVDQEHKKLFECCNNILAFDPQSDDFNNFKSLVKELYDYVRYHFQHEEEIMQKYEYSLIGEHKQWHNLIIYEMNKYLAQSRNSSTLLTHFKGLADKWIKQHIQEEDMKFRNYLGRIGELTPE